MIGHSECQQFAIGVGILRSRCRLLDGRKPRDPVRAHTPITTVVIHLGLRMSIHSGRHLKNKQVDLGMSFLLNFSALSQMLYI